MLCLDIGDWGPWNFECIHSCGETVQRKTRECLPADDYDEDRVDLCPPSCIGSSEEEEECDAGLCPGEIMFFVVLILIQASVLHPTVYSDSCILVLF